MKSKRFAAAGLAAIMAASLFTACGSSGQSQGADSSTKQESGTSSQQAGTSSQETGEQVTLKVSLWDVTSNPADVAAIKEFEAQNPDIKIDLVDIPSNDYITKLNTMLNGGSQLDVFFVKEADGLKTFYDKGQLLNITPYIEESGIDLEKYHGSAGMFEIEGNQYALPARTDYYVLYYNKDIFDAKGIEYPSNDMTWAEFEDLAAELTGDGNYGAYFHTWPALVWNWAIQDGQNTIMSYENGYTFAKPAYEMVLRMQEAGVIQEYGQLKSGNVHYSGVFAQGNVAMMPMGTWFMATMKSKVDAGETDMNWGVANVPHWDNLPAGSTVGAHTPLAINAKTQYPEQAWRFVEFMTGDGGAQKYAENGYIPSCFTDELMATVANGEGMPEGLTETLQGLNPVPDRPIQDHVKEVDKVIGEQHSMIMLGESTVDEGLAELAKQAKEIVEG